MARLSVPDRCVDAFCGRTPKSVLARHYTYYSPERLKEIYDSAGMMHGFAAIWSVVVSTVWGPVMVVVTVTVVVTTVWGRVVCLRCDVFGRNEEPPITEFTG